MHESDGGDEPVRHHPRPDDPAAPLRLGDIQADDALIDALGSGHLRTTDEMAASDDVDDRLAALLASWVAAVNEPGAPRDGALAAAEAAATEPAEADAETPADGIATVPVEVRAANGDMATRHRRRRDRPSYLARLSAAAVVAIAVTGGIAVGNADTARPGDVLWPVAKVFYRDHAQSVEAADTVAVHLERARTALRQGRTADAAREVNDMQAALAVVLPADGRASLDAQHTSIVAIVAATPDAVLLDPQLRAPAVPDVAGAVALGLPRAPGLPDPPSTAALPTDVLTATLPPPVSSSPPTGGTSEVPLVVTEPTAPVVPPLVDEPPVDQPPVDQPPDTAPVEPPPYIPPRTDPPVPDPGTDTDTDNGAQGTTEAPATTDPGTDQPAAAGTDTDSGSTDPVDPGPADTGSADTGSADTGPADTGSEGTTDTASTDTGSGTPADTGSTDGTSATGTGDQSGSQDQGGSQDSGGSLLSVSADASLGVAGTSLSGTLGINL
ncbi:anti-sigma-D factor RsdA [Pseudonocardia sp. N23]|uniref:anti-sigma-D factor RsdA n=1 Tax=Pseudonocardia sp. N23 TaxID=1987376 RepID=UPI000BFDE1E1|nr:anti-sigma-D factor RsdA [Pseudonocardia sp. N23]GAY09873.1 hypothetical protein TOK_4229 [Pseudonocardia sp. N23]